MVLFEGALGLGVGFLLAVAFAQYAKIKADKGFTWLAVSGVFFLFSATFTDKFFGTGGILSGIGILGTAFELVGWLFALIAAVFVAYETLLEK